MKKTIFLHVSGALTLFAICYLSLRPIESSGQGIPHLDKVGHFIAYLSVSFNYLLLKYSRKKIFLFFLIFGVAIEFIQEASGYRYFEFADMIANCSGQIAATLLFIKFRKKLA